MPKMDGTGPEGKGMATGRGGGRCGKNRDEGSNRGQGKGPGRGRNEGRGQNKGRGSQK